MKNPGAAELDEAGWNRLDEAIHRLEQSWQTKAEPDLARFIPPVGDPLRRCLAIALVKVDQEHCWESGHGRKLEQYLAYCPELARDPAAIRELLEFECLTRALFGAVPTREELRGRFPDMANRIDLAGIAAEASRERSGQREALDSLSTAGSARRADMYTPATGRERPPLEVGQQFGRYEVLALLGRGGMGWVYRARDTQLPREVALKVPRFDTTAEPDARRRFALEWKVLATVGHTNICTIYDAGEIDGTCFITMELMEGQSLADRLRQGSIPPAGAARLVEKLCRALAEVHGAGIIHRDIKPSNVMIDRHGEPKLMDFGLARLVGAADVLRETLASLAPGTAGPLPQRAPDASGYTSSGALLGTLPYMSPQQIEGRPADAPSDVYSMGVLLYQLLTGRVPFGSKKSDLVARVEGAAPPDPRSLCPTADGALAAICLKAMHYKPAARYQSAAEMAAALRQYQQKAARPPWYGRWKPLVSMAGAAAAAVLFGVVIYVKTNNGTLALEVNPPDAKVAIDGDTVRVGLPGEEITLVVGNHELEVSREGYYKLRQPFTIERSGKLNIAATLKSLPPPLLERSIETGFEYAVAPLRLSKDGATLFLVRMERPNTSQVQAFDVATGRALHTVDFPNFSYDHKGLAISPDDRYLFVTNYERRDISRIDLRDHNRRTDLLVGGVPHSVWAAEVIDVSPDGRKLVVGLGQDGRPNDEDNDYLSIVDMADGRFALLGTAKLDDESTGFGVGFSDDSRFAYVVTLPHKSPAPMLYEVSLEAPYKVARKLAFPEGALRGLAVAGKQKRAFVSDQVHRCLWVVDLDSFETVSSIKLEGYAPGPLVLSPRENVLAALCPDSLKVILVNCADGALLGRVGVQQATHYAQFSPDQRWLFVPGAEGPGRVGVVDLGNLALQYRIVFASNRGGEGYQLYAMDGDGRNVVRLTENRATDRSPAWSPDGRRLAFISDRDGPPRIFLANADGSGAAPLERTDVTQGTPLDWSPDGGQIVFFARRQTAIRVVDVRNGSVRTLVEGELAPGFGYHTSVSWRKSDGALIVGSQSPVSGYHADLFQIGPRSGQITRLTTEADGPEKNIAPVASPDGRQMAAVRNVNLPSPATNSLCLMGADARGLRLLPQTVKGFYWSPRWSPDGQNLVCQVRDQRDQSIWHICLAGLSGTKPVQLNGGQWSDVEPDIRQNTPGVHDAAR